MPLTICEYRGYRMSLYSSDAGHSALIHRSGVILAFARSSREEGFRVAFEKARAIVDKAHRESPDQGTPMGRRHRDIGRPRH